MESKQTFAKLGVLVLLGINVGAYYYFWPRNEVATKSAAKSTTEKGEAQLLPAKSPALPESRSSTPLVAIPLAIPNPVRIPALPASPVEPMPRSDDDSKAILKLLAHIGDAKAPFAPMASAESTKDETPALSPMKTLPIEPLHTDTKKPDLTGVLAMPNAPPLWHYRTDKAGQRTQVTATLRDAAERGRAEFHILCDRVEANPQTGIVQALGNITFLGAGWKGSCQKLTLAVHEPQVVLEDKVQVEQDILGTAQMGVVRGERIVWELPPAPAPVQAAPVKVGASGITQPLRAERPGLGLPN